MTWSKIRKAQFFIIHRQIMDIDIFVIREMVLLFYLCPNVIKGEFFGKWPNNRSKNKKY